MPSIIKAPGKLVLTGEHSVVYGESALLTSINLYTKFSFTSRSDQIINIIYGNGKNPFKITINSYTLDLKNYFCEDFAQPYFPPPYIMQDLKSQICEHIPQGIDEAYLDIYFAIALGMCIGIEPSKVKKLGLNIEIDSDIPVACGLGFSASFSSCLSALILILNEKIQPELFNSFYPLINRWALLFENFFHGKSSGMDNACSVYGGLIAYKKGSFKHVLCSDHFNKIKFLIIETGKKKSTALAVKTITNLRLKHQAIIENIFSTIGIVTESFVDVVENTEMKKEDFKKNIRTLLKVNQGCMVALDLDCHESNSISLICQKHGFVNKITGAGAGGVTFIMMCQEDSIEDYEALRKEISFNGYKNYEVQSTCAGIILK